MDKYYVNESPTGFTVIVDGKLKGARIKTRKEAEHVGKLATDEQYAFTFRMIQADPGKAIDALKQSWNRKPPAHYAREARQIHWWLRGQTQPSKGVGLLESPMTWEGAKNHWAEAWKDELYRYLGSLLKDLRRVEDAEAIKLVTQMGHALRHDDRETYYKNLDKLMEYYGDIW